MGSHPQRQYSVDDYHRIEQTSPIRHEFFDGAIFAMAGGSVAHNHISANVLATLRNGLAKTPCSAFGSDMRLLTPAGLLTYPDVMVICDQVEIVAGRQDEVTNPVLLVEVLSDATRNYDRGDKFDFYKSIPTFREYILIEQSSVAVEVHIRDSQSNWSSAAYNALNEVVALRSARIQLALAEIYRRVF